MALLHQFEWTSEEVDIIEPAEIPAKVDKSQSLNLPINKLIQIGDKVGYKEA